MIRAVLIINLFFISLTACRQKTKDFFTGTIKYQYTYSSNTLNPDSLAESRPAAAVFRYDLADYQSMFTGKDTIIYYYAGKKNKALSAAGNPVSFSCEDYGQVTDSTRECEGQERQEQLLLPSIAWPRLWRGVPRWGRHRSERRGTSTGTMRPARPVRCAQKGMSISS